MNLDLKIYQNFLSEETRKICDKKIKNIMLKSFNKFLESMDKSHQDEKISSLDKKVRKKSNQSDRTKINISKKDKNRKVNKIKISKIKTKKTK